MLLQHRVEGRRDGQDGRLRVFRQLQLILGTFEAELRDLEPEGLVDFVKDTARVRVSLEEIASHAGVLASLSGEDEGGAVLHCGADDIETYVASSCDWCSRVCRSLIFSRIMTSMRFMAKSRATRTAFLMAFAFERP